MNTHRGVRWQARALASSAVRSELTQLVIAVCVATWLAGTSSGALSTLEIARGGTSNAETRPVTSDSPGELIFFPGRPN